MGYKTSDSIISLLFRIAEALEGIDTGLAGIEDTLHELKEEEHVGRSQHHKCRCGGHCNWQKTGFSGPE